MKEWPLGNFPDKFPRPNPSPSPGFGAITAACVIGIGLLFCVTGGAGFGVILIAVGIITWLNRGS